MNNRQSRLRDLFKKPEAVACLMPDQLGVNQTMSEDTPSFLVLVRRQGGWPSWQEDRRSHVFLSTKLQEMEQSPIVLLFEMLSGQGTQKSVLRQQPSENRGSGLRHYI